MPAGLIDLKTIDSIPRFMDSVSKSVILKNSYAIEGNALGLAEGDPDGDAEGDPEGLADGDAEGFAKGCADGDSEGKPVGIMVGAGVGAQVFTTQKVLYSQLHRSNNTSNRLPASQEIILVGLPFKQRAYS